MTTQKISISNPIAMRTTSTAIKLGEDWFDFTDAITAVAFTPRTSGNSITAVNSVTHSSATAATWTADITLAQDDSQDSFLDFLNENEGSKAILQTKFTDTGRIREAEVTLVAVAIGGSADGKIKTSSVSMPSSKPEITEGPMGTTGA